MPQISPSSWILIWTTTLIAGHIIVLDSIIINNSQAITSNTNNTLSTNENNTIIW